ncbi:MAG: SGNH/GDSL hydrolase family protein [Desulfocapsa sp.]|nr:SGNH/GDSL hydrolase family protein [Desulfocapsa sp.]
MKHSIRGSCCKSYLPFFLFSCLIFSLPAIVFADTDTIIAFGDSLTEGCDVYAGECGWERSGTHGYEIELEILLKKSFRNYEIHNFGRGGETAQDGMVRIDSVMRELCNAGAEYILLLEGTNDLLHGARGTDVKYYLDVMIDKSRDHGLVPLIATIPPDPEHAYKDIPLMNSYIRDLASEKNVPLVELYNEMYPMWNSYTPGCYGDRTHPNSAGFQTMGEIWFESLSGLIQPKPPLTWLELLLK